MVIYRIFTRKNSTPHQMVAKKLVSSWVLWPKTRPSDPTILATFIRQMVTQPISWIRFQARSSLKVKSTLMPLSSLYSTRGALMIQIYQMTVTWRPSRMLFDNSRKVRIYSLYKRSSILKLSRWAKWVRWVSYHAPSIKARLITELLKSLYLESNP